MCVPPRARAGAAAGRGVRALKPLSSLGVGPGPAAHITYFSYMCES